MDAPGLVPTAGYLLGSIEILGFNFAPQGFAACQGQILPITQNQQLFSLLGPSYGGNGVSNFALPKLAPMTPAGPFYYICIAGAYPQRA
jgi:microcystin-dependent protein